MEPLGRRLVPVFALLLIAPVCAEYLQAYLPQTGDALVLVAGLLVLGPLYGGAALLIREVTVRTGRGWTGTLLLAAAFGLLMTSTVDGSMWLVHDTRVTYWDDMREGTLIEPLGFPAFPVLAWITGHAVYSVGAPLLLVDALAPRHRGRPLLGRPGLAVVATLCVVAAILIHQDPGYAWPDPSARQTWSSVLGALALVALALTPVGRPHGRREGRPTRWTPLFTLVAAFVGLTALDVTPYTWVGVAAYAAGLALGGWLLLRAARSTAWGPAQLTALAVGAVLERTLLGFVAPLPPGVSLGAKLVTGVVLLVLVAGVSVLAWRRARECTPSRQKLTALSTDRLWTGQ